MFRRECKIILKKIVKHAQQGTLLPIFKNKIKQKCFPLDNYKNLQKQLENDIKQRTQGKDDAGKDTLKRVINHRIFKNRGLSDEYINNLICLMEKRCTFKEETLDLHDTVLQQTQDLNPSSLPCERWLVLCHICIFSGLFRIGNIARDKAIERAYQEVEQAPEDPETIIMALKAAMEEVDLDRANALLILLQKKMPESKITKELEFYHSLFTNANGFYREGETKYSPSDKRFAEYIDGKSIAIVGPAPSEEELALEIDSYDIVIRLNYRGKGLMPCQKEFGNRIDISYYNGENAQKISDLNAHDFFDDLEYAVFKSIKHEFQKGLLSSQRARALFSPDSILFNGTGNMIPLMLYDLSHFSPKKIKVFKVNLFLAKKAYYGGYSLYEGRPGVSWMWRSFAVHNPTTQFNFVKSFWKSGLIEVDNSCEAVLKLTSSEYISAMEEIYVTEPMELMKASEECSRGELYI